MNVDLTNPKISYTDVVKVYGVMDGRGLAEDKESWCALMLTKIVPEQREMDIATLMDIVNCSHHKAAPGEGARMMAALLERLLATQNTEMYIHLLENYEYGMDFRDHPELRDLCARLEAIFCPPGLSYRSAQGPVQDVLRSSSGMDRDWGFSLFEVCFGIGTERMPLDRLQFVLPRIMAYPNTLNAWMSSVEFYTSDEEYERDDLNEEDIRVCDIVRGVFLGFDDSETYDLCYIYNDVRERLAGWGHSRFDFLAKALDCIFSPELTETQSYKKNMMQVRLDRKEATETWK